MGYLFVAIALLAGATKGFCGKKTSGLTAKYSDAALFNLVRMLFCVAVGAVVLLLEGSGKYIVPPVRVLPIAALSGVATSIFVVSWLISVKKGSYMMIDVFLMLGTLIPILLGNLFFSEKIEIKAWIGFSVLLAAVIIMCSYNNTIKEKMTPASVILLVIAGLANGFADFSQKLFVNQLPELPISIFNFYTYVFSALTLAIVYILFKAKYKEESEKAGIRSAVIYILIMSVCLFINSYFKTAAAQYLDSARLYPLNQGLALVISLAMSSALFGEKLTVRAVVGVVMAFAGLLIINVL